MTACIIYEVCKVIPYYYANFQKYQFVKSAVPESAEEKAKLAQVLAKFGVTLRSLLWSKKKLLGIFTSPQSDSTPIKAS